MTDEKSKNTKPDNIRRREGSGATANQSNNRSAIDSPTFGAAGTTDASDKHDPLGVRFPFLYPVSAPRRSGYIKRGNLHRVYWESHGNPEGTPVLCLHGGPGSGISSWHARLFPPDKNNIVLFDQRGCGKSQPFAELQENTTQHLVEDMEALREELGVEKWHIFGGSWGSFLALAYADSYSERIMSLLLYGIFLCRPKELSAILSQDGVAANLYPDYFEEFLKPLSIEGRHDPMKAYEKLFHDPDPTIRQDALRRWSHWELRLASLVPDERMFSIEGDDMAMLEAHSLLELHYFKNKGFMNGDALLAGIGKKLANIPLEIVQGRCDFVCPPETAWKLHKAVPHSQITFIAAAGHTAKETETMPVLFEKAGRL